MEIKPVIPDLANIPSLFHPLLNGAAVYDSSCSEQAQVFFIQRHGGYYLKSAPAGSLKIEADMTAYFHSKGLSAEVLAYETTEQDWLLTRRIQGEDCLAKQYVDNPVRLCDTTAHLLRMLHDVDPCGCPVTNRTTAYISNARDNYHANRYDKSHFPDNWGYSCAADALRVIERDASYLKSDTLLHGDYCLPNILLDNWKFSGFIDLGSGGMGDRHIDLFWGIWSLWFNLKTDHYRDRFLDAYGRNDVNEDVFHVIAAIEVFG